MLAKTYTYAINGLEAYPITIEVDVARGLPATKIVGLPDNAIKESKERIRSAIRNSDFDYRPKRVTINLSPADTKKEGPSFDLPIALGILAASEQISSFNLKDYIFVGELSLDGRVQPVRGALTIALSMDKKFKGIIVPHANANEAALTQRTNVFPVHNLNEVVYLLEQLDSVQPFSPQQNLHPQKNSYNVDFSEVKGQGHVKRGLEIAAAGRHNCLLIGAPGTGKSMLAKRLPTILPDMSIDESLETTCIHSNMGFLRPGEGLMKHRPFRSPHHTTSDVAIVGGGSNPRPGEVTFSHNGILFLDELPEFNRNVLEALRQPLEDKIVTIARASKTLQFPADFMLIAAMNPCPCGWFMDRKKDCQCTPNQIQKYMSKISGPLLDRIDLHLEVPTLPPHDIISDPASECSAVIKRRAHSAREIQTKRFDNSFITANAQMNHKQIKHHCPLSSDCKTLLKAAIDELNLSARAYDKILKVARTIADLASKENISIEHLAEAIQYRSLDRDWWG